MRILKIYLSCFVLLMHGLSCAKYNDPSSTLSAYSNKVDSAAFSVGSDGIYAITLQCQVAPLCLYVPATYQDFLNENKKTYFLPRTRCSDHQMDVFIRDIQDQLAMVGIQMECNPMIGKNFGLEFNFEFNSNLFEIEKNINKEEKLVIFKIKLKN